MKLIYYIIIRISLVLSVLLTGWAILFYFAVMDEVNDEVDDSLEDYSEIIIIRALAGEELPSKNTASNNQYFLREVTKEYAGSCDDIIYKDLEHEVDKKLLMRAMTTLTEREKMIIELRFGINQKEGEEKTQKEVADLLGISQSYISRLEKKIIKRLKKEMIKMGCV